MAKTGFIGAGKMGGAILGAFLKSGKIAAEDVVVCEATPERAADVADKFKVATTTDPLEVVTSCRTVFLAVKPQDLDALLARLSPKLKATTLLVSIAAGKTLGKIREAAGPKPRLIRVMPNLAALVGEGMLVYTPDASATRADCKNIESLLSECGTVIRLDECHFDAVTALSGSGPAFFAYVMKSMASAGEAVGLPADVAALLSEKTMLGTAKYLSETKQNTADFIKAVCSPKGTTEAGMKKLSGSAVDGVLAKTIAAAAKRSAELSSI